MKSFKESSKALADALAGDTLPFHALVSEDPSVVPGPNVPIPLKSGVFRIAHFRVSSKPILAAALMLSTHATMALTELDNSNHTDPTGYTLHHLHRKDLLQQS